ncbi:hypothetical protein CBR_g66793 [Chara braunii]|uniref:Uncharacterized protein n=1 Tax=Chara braunii TaxID=69332 RepID=A0A388K9F1_CHABU|nr:hypothetical protein CBR_g66793 [Chara braunii]|eukprot:GBG66657.1 hypothetical protein CBR_g66793 [Chara braunii]
MEGESSENKLGKLEESAAIQCLLNIRETASMTELQSSSSDTKTGKEDEAPSPKSDSFTSPYAGEIFGGSVGIKHHLVKALKGERKKKGVPSTSSGRSSPRSEGKRSSFFKKQTDAPDSPNSQKYSVKEGMRRSRALAMKRFAKPTSPVSTVRFETGMELCGLAKEKVDALRKEHGFNEVVAQLTPEWKKFVQRYLGVIPMLMVGD